MFFPVAQRLDACGLNVKPMRSCPKLSNDTSEMLVAAILDVQLAAISHLYVLVHQ